MSAYLFHLFPLAVMVGLAVLGLAICAYWNWLDER